MCVSALVIAALAFVSQEVRVDCADETEAAALTASVCELPAGKRLAFSTRWDDTNPRHADMAEMLSVHGFKGTFYLFGFTTNDAALVRSRMLPCGAGIGNHTVRHDSLGMLLPNAVHREILRQRVDEETQLGVPANVFVLPYSSCHSVVEASAERNVGDCLARAGMIGGSERNINSGLSFGFATNEWVGSFTFSVNDADPDEKLFRDQFAKGLAMALKGQLPCGPSLTLGIHTWQKGAEGLAKLGRIIAPEAHRPDVWYCTFNEYAAFRLTALNAEIRKASVSGKTAVFAVRRPAIRDVGASVPLTLRFSNGVVRDVAPPDRLPTSVAFVPDAIRYDAVSETVFVSVRNDDVRPWHDIAVTLRLPPAFVARTLTKTLAHVESGASVEVSFACGARRTDPLHLEGDWYFAAQVDAEGVRRWSDLDVQRPASPMACPRDNAQVVGPVFLEALTNLDLRALAMPGAPLPSFGASPRETPRCPGPFAGAAPYALSLYPSARETWPVNRWLAEEAKGRPTAFLVAFDLVADVRAHGAEARLLQIPWTLKDWCVWVNGKEIDDPLRPFGLRDGVNRVFVRIACTSRYSFRQEFGVAYVRDGQPVGFARQDFLPQDYGAKGNGTTLDTVALQKAIDACAAAGGGRVVLRGGAFRSGTLYLRSHVDLHIEKGATLLGSQKEADYPRTYRFRHHDSAKMPRYDSGAWLIADEATDVSISGEGTIDCDGDCFVEKKPLDKDGTWSGWEYRRKPNRRPIPRVVVFTGCSDVSVGDITFTRAPAGWGFWVHDCDRVRFERVKIRTDVHYPNNDGIHINASRDVLVEDCDIETGDDSIVVRANCVTLKEDKPCERVTVRNCRLRSFTNGIRLGWVNDGAVRDCRFEKIDIRDSSCGIGIVMPPPVWGPSDVGREATRIERILFKDITMDRMYAHPLLAGISNHEGTKVDYVGDIVFENLKCRALQHLQVGGRDRNHFQNFRFKDCVFEKVSEDAFPGYWKQQGAASWDRHFEDKRYNADGFVFDNCRFIDRTPKISDFNDGWQFSRNDTNHFVCVEIPHDWAIAEPFDPEQDGGAGRLPWKGVGYYRKSFSVSEEGFRDRVGRSIRLAFDGVMCRSRVFVNGREAGGNDYGYVGYEVEIAPLLYPGVNEILVKIDTLDLRSRWYPGAGLYRRVRLLEGVRETPFIYSTDVSPTAAVVHVEASWTNFSFTVANPRLWSLEDPHLYELTLGGSTYRYGIRSFAFMPAKGFFLNGRRVQLKGVNLHADLGILGMAYNRSAARRQLLRMKEMGANALRTAHNPVAPETLDLCDELGIFVWNECFDKWDDTSGRKDRNLEAYVDEQLERLVKRDRNHPCVFAWSIGNEIHPVSQNPAKYPDGTTRARCRQFRETVRRFDRTRPVGIGSCFSGDVLKSDDYDDLDITGWNYCAQYRNYFRRFPNRPVLYTESASAVSSYGFYAERLPETKTAYAVADREVDSMDMNSAPWSDVPDKEFERMESDRYCGGEFVWTGTDYLGEPFPYMHYLIPEILKLPTNELARSSYFGICDLLHLPKDRYYLYRSHWRSDAVTVHLVPSHWNFEGREGQSRPVYVYSNADEVELFLNGRSLGRRRKDVTLRSKDRVKDTSDPGAVGLEVGPADYFAILDRYRFRFNDVVYEPGELRAVAYAKGGKIGEDVVRTAGEPMRVSLEPEAEQVPADGETLVFVTVVLRDAKGVPVPKRSDRVFFTLKGKGTIVSVGNADPRGTDSFKATASHGLYNGRAGLFIRRLKGCGHVPLSLTARVEGLDAATIDFK